MPENFYIRASDNGTLKRKVQKKGPEEFHLEPFFVGLHVKEIHLLGHGNALLTFHTIKIKLDQHHYILQSHQTKVIIRIVTNKVKPR